MQHHSFFRNIPILHTSINIVLLSHDILKLTINIIVDIMEVSFCQGTCQLLDLWELCTELLCRILLLNFNGLSGYFFLGHGAVILYLLLLIFTSLMPPHFLIPLNSKRDKHLISSNSITPESNIKVMRIKEMITNSRSSWLLEKFYLKLQRKYEELRYWCYYWKKCQWEFSCLVDARGFWKWRILSVGHGEAWKWNGFVWVYRQTASNRRTPLQLLV